MKLTGASLLFFFPPAESWTFKNGESEVKDALPNKTRTAF